MKDNRKTDVKSTIQALDQISANTLQMIDESAKNLAKGIAGKPVDFAELDKELYRMD